MYDDLVTLGPGSDRGFTTESLLGVNGIVARVMKSSPRGEVITANC